MQTSVCTPQGDEWEKQHRLEMFFDELSDGIWCLERCIEELDPGDMADVIRHVRNLGDYEKQELRSSFAELFEVLAKLSPIMQVVGIAPPIDSAASGWKNIELVQMRGRE